MNIVRDDCDERRRRVDRMVDELRKAQSRRLADTTSAKSNDHVVHDAMHRQRSPANCDTAFVEPE